MPALLGKTNKQCVLSGILITISNSQKLPSTAWLLT